VQHKPSASAGTQRRERRSWRERLFLSTLSAVAHGTAQPAEVRVIHRLVFRRKTRSEESPGQPKRAFQEGRHLAWLAALR